MPNPSLSVSTPSAGPRRLRPAAPRGMGGGSSMLRLSRSADTRLPSGAALSDWAERAASMLDLTPMPVGPRPGAPRAAAGTPPALFMLGTHGVQP